MPERRLRLIRHLLRLGTMSYWVYVLTNKKNGALYTGVTNDLGKRIVQHRSGTGSLFTAKYKLGLLVYAQEFGDPVSAIAAEKAFKEVAARLEGRLDRTRQSGMAGLTGRCRIRRKRLSGMTLTLVSRPQFVIAETRLRVIRDLERCSARRTTRRLSQWVAGLTGRCRIRRERLSGMTLALVPGPQFVIAETRLRVIRDLERCSARRITRPGSQCGAGAFPR